MATPQAAANNDITLADLYRYLEEGRKTQEKALEAREKAWEADRKAQEKAREEDRKAREASIRDFDKRLGYLSNRFGEVVEYMIVPNLVAKFNELGYVFTKANPDTVIKDPAHGIFAEIDAFLENGDSVMIVEIKTKPHADDIDDHIKRMEKLRVYADLHNDKRKYYGAIAGVVMSDSVKAQVLNNGFYMIEPSGETLTITAPTGTIPKAW
jgi:hypothetical protein